jgi:hypothetical protein
MFCLMPAAQLKMPKLDRSRTGRRKGTPNKTTALLKDAVLQAAGTAGGQGGLAGYLALQATLNPGPFMALLGKVLPLQLQGDEDHPLKMVVEWQSKES